MQLLKTILVGVNFDEALEPMLAAVNTLAKKFGSEVVLTHVVETGDWLGPETQALQTVKTARLTELQQKLIANGVKAPKVFCLQGKAFTEIMAAADWTEARLIVLGARAIGTSHPFAMGTTTENVIRYSSRPVLAVPIRPQLAFGSILCPVDFSEASARGLTTAIHLARAFRSRLQIVTVVGAFSPHRRLEAPWVEPSASPEQTVEARCHRAFDEFLACFDLQDLAWEKHVLSGEAAHEIVERAKSTSADLIVMGSEGRKGLPYLFMGSTAVKVARLLPCSLFTVKSIKVLAPEIAKNLADINAAFAEGHALLGQGFCQEAVAQFDRCLAIDARCVDAIEAKAEAFDRLRRQAQADECRKLAENIRRELSGQRATAEVRASHPLFRRRGTYDS